MVLTNAPRNVSRVTTLINRDYGGGASKKAGSGKNVGSGVGYSLMSISLNRMSKPMPTMYTPSVSMSHMFINVLKKA